MAALPIAAAAALGFVGASSTSFVLGPRTAQTPATAAPTAGFSSAQTAGQPGAAADGATALCASFAVGAVAAAATRRSKVARGPFVDDGNDINRANEYALGSKWRIFRDTWGVPYKKSTTPEKEIDIMYSTSVISWKPIWNESNWDKFAGGLIGAESAWGGKQPFDPIDFAGMYPEHVPWYREAELKHGRVAMLAMIGIIAQDTFRIPIPDLENPALTILNSHKMLIYGLGQGPMWWVLVFASLIESLRFKDLGLDFGKLTLENAGDLNFGKGFLPKTEQGILDMKLKELKNGRLAMLAFSGCITQAAFFDKPHFPYYGN